MPALFLACLLPVGPAWADVIVYTPEPGTGQDPFLTSGTSDAEIFYPFASAFSGANKNNGGLAVYAGAWAGGGAASASQYISFDVIWPSSVEASVVMTYAGGAFNYAHASFSGSDWRWRLDDNAWHNHHIDDPFAADIIAGKIIDLVLLAAGEVAPEGAIADLIDAIELAWTFQNLKDDMQALLDASKATKVTNTFDFTVSGGHHELAVGLQASASAFLTGFGCSLLRGQIEKITLDIDTHPDIPPDLIIGGIVIPVLDQTFIGQGESSTQASTQRVEVVKNGYITQGELTEIRVSRCNIGGQSTSEENYSLLVYDPAGNVTTVVDARFNRDPFAPDSTRTDTVYHTFTAKGRHRILAFADGVDEVVEPGDATNNVKERYVRVRGTPPTVPDRPLVVGQPAYGVRLHRNRTYTYTTSATEPDNEPLYYAFQIATDPLGDEDEWTTLTNQTASSTNGWSISSNVFMTPVLEDPDLLPGTNIDEKTHFVISTNKYYIQALAADADGIADPSIAAGFTVVLNEEPDTPTLGGDTFGNTLGGVSVTAASDDEEGDTVAFRFDWGEEATPAWTEWMWRAEGQSSITAAHVYANSGSYAISVQATDSYSSRYTEPVKTSGTALRGVTIYDYAPPSNALTVVTTKAGGDTPLPGTGFTITGDTNLTTVTGSDGIYESPAMPGSYTCTFHGVTGHITPVAQAGVLAAGGSLTFSVEYPNQIGALAVHCNVAGEGRIHGQGTAAGAVHDFSGTSWSAGDAWVGNHLIRYEDVDALNYGLPTPRSETKTLTTGGSVSFLGRYIKRPVPVLSFDYPTNSQAYNPPNAFALVGEDVVHFDATASWSPGQPRGTGPPYLFPELILSNAAYRFRFDDGRVYREETTYAPDTVFDGVVAHTFRLTGTRTVGLTVWDSAGCPSSIPDVAQVWVKERPVAHITIDPSPAIAGERIFFTGDGTDGDPGDTIVGYAWESNLEGALATSRTFWTDSLTLGRHTISLRVLGSDNVWSKPAHFVLNVSRPREWPLFKRDVSRLSAQADYRQRTHGKLPYAPAVGAWPFPADSPIAGSPVAANLDDDWTNGLEIVFVSSNGTLYNTRYSGAPGWSVPVGRSSSTPAIGDLDDDGSPDIVLGTWTNVWSLDATGGVNFSYMPSNPPCSFEYSMPVIADIDPDVPGREVAITADDGSLHLVYADGTAGTNQWPFAYGAPLVTNPMFFSAPAVADLDAGRAGLEVVVGGTDGRVYVLDSSGNSVASYLIPGTNEIHTTPAIYDLCPQVPGQEIVVGADDGVLYCLNYFNSTLTRVWQYAVSPYGMIRSSPAVGVVGEYHEPQVVFGSDNGNVYVLLGTNGMSIGTYNCGPGVAVVSTPAIANIDTASSVHPLMGDLPEVIVGASDGTLHAVSFAFGAAAVWQPPISLSPQPPIYPIHASPAVADINHDPELEILIASTDGNLYLVEATAIPALAPMVAFSASTNQGGRPLDVVFTDDSDNDPISWTWDFGDGAVSTEQDPTHTYDVPGIYTVILTVCNDHGCTSLTNNAYITVDPVPAADFGASPILGDVPLAVQFTDQSLYGPGVWSWDFGDSNGSASQHPVHFYTSPGIYTVSLTVSNAYGQDTAVHVNAITVEAVSPVANFVEDVTYGCEPLSVDFTDLSAHVPEFWSWDFGDGGTSSEQHPTHEYETVGQYLVSLTVSNAAGADTLANALYMTVMSASEPVATPVIDLPLDEGAGLMVYDATTNGNDGAISGPTWDPAGFNGSALYFHGGGQWANGDAVTVLHDSGLNPARSFAIEARIKAGGSDNYLAIVDKYHNAGLSYGYTLYLSSGRLRFSVYSGANGNVDAIGTTELRDNTWHHVRGVWDGVVIAVEVDGFTEKVTPWAFPPAATTQDLGIGKRLGGHGGYLPFLGLIDEVQISVLQPSSAPRLSIFHSGGQIGISWTDCGTLQTAPALEGPWLDLLRTSHPHSVTSSSPHTYFRLSVP